MNPSHLKDILISKNILLEIKFHIELKDLKDTFLINKLDQYLINPVEGNIISDKEIDVNLYFININTINDFIKKFILKANSPAMHSLISKNIPTDNKNFTYGINATHYRIGEGEINNLYVSNVQNAFGIIWECDNEESIWYKARDIKSLIHKAIKQIKNEDSGIIHIGLETYDGPEIERKRLEKITKTINQIDSTKTSLEWIYCHYFQSYTRPTK